MRTLDTKITVRQEELLFIIYQYIKDTGYPPTFEEMRDKLGVISNQSIIDLLGKLEKQKLIKRNESSARSITILPLGYELLEKPHLVPFLGVTKAGIPVETLEIPGEWKTLSGDVAQLKGDVYLLKISGDSMINAGIEGGDIVLVKSQKEFVSGDIVLAQIEGDSTIKRFISEDKSPYVYLKPENSEYDIIPFTDETNLIGKVISIFKAKETDGKLNREAIKKQIFGTSLNGINLSFASVREYERTKHVHRLHPYLGKFIPQLVEVFLHHYFKKGDSILDPFMGSGTTLIEANILGMHSAGIEISLFNCLIADIKTRKYDISLIEKEIKDILFKTKEYSKWLPQREKQTILLENYFKKYKINSEYLNKWLSDRALQEILFYRNQIKNYKNQDILKIILSRATRSARLIPHYDLARPQKPVREKYYCIKHRRICEPINEAIKFINRYSWDTIRRLKEFDNLRTSATIKVIQGDSREIDFNKIDGYKEGEFDGIFTSPPYVGLIDYHDQHRYAYELFGFDDNGFKEIGPASKGRSRKAKEEYKNGIITVFQNMNRFLKPKAKIFVVVNDRDNLYPDIAKACDYKIEKIYHRPVLMRTERDNARFSESIYYFIKK